MGSTFRESHGRGEKFGGNNSDSDHAWREWSHEGLTGEPMVSGNGGSESQKITINNNNNKKFPQREKRKEKERVSWEQISEEEGRRSESLRQTSLWFWVSRCNLGLVLLTRVKVIGKCCCGCESEKMAIWHFLIGWQEPRRNQWGRTKTRKSVELLKE